MYRELKCDGYCGIIYADQIELLAQAFRKDKTLEINLTYAGEESKYGSYFDVYAGRNAKEQNVKDAWLRFDELKIAEHNAKQKFEIEIDEMREFTTAFDVIVQKAMKGMRDAKDSVL